MRRKVLFGAVDGKVLEVWKADAVVKHIIPEHPEAKRGAHSIRHVQRHISYQGESAFRDAHGFHAKSCSRYQLLSEPSGGANGTYGSHFSSHGFGKPAR